MRNLDLPLRYVFADEQRPYDEHVVSKIPHLRERYRPSGRGNSCRSL
jgi:hypothetical protein